MATFVLVPGAWLGGWCWQQVTPLLRGAGHDVYTPTLTGLGERQHLANPGIGLDTHVQDVANMLEWEDLREVVLVGHSYAGFVVRGVAERAAERIARLVYLDTIEPRNGQSFFNIAPPEFQMVVEAQAQQAGDGWRWPLPEWEEMGQYMSLTGFNEERMAWMRAKSVAHPVKPFSQAVGLESPAAQDLPRGYIRCTADAADDAVAAQIQLARSDGRWRYHELPSGHWPMVTHPQALAEALWAFAG